MFMHADGCWWRLDRVFCDALRHLLGVELASTLFQHLQWCRWPRAWNLKRLSTAFTMVLLFVLDDHLIVRCGKGTPIRPTRSSNFQPSAAFYCLRPVGSIKTGWSTRICRRQSFELWKAKKALTFVRSTTSQSQNPKNHHSSGRCELLVSWSKLMRFSLPKKTSMGQRHTCWRTAMPCTPNKSCTKVLHGVAIDIKGPKARFKSRCLLHQNSLICHSDHSDQWHRNGVEGVSGQPLGSSGEDLWAKATQTSSL